MQRGVTVTSDRYPLHAALTGKGILGPSIGESGQKVGDLSGGSVSSRFAASNGVLVENGKFKCPPGTAGAGDFTDALGSTCGTPSSTEGAKGLLQKVKSKSNRFSEGSFVRWGSSGGDAQGQVEYVMTDGTLGIPGSKFTIEAKPDDPAVLIRIWKKRSNGWTATETLVGHKASTLSSIEPLAKNQELSEKVGLAGSHSTPLQGIQGVASLATPGDMSDVRSPVRSTLWEIITPGGGKDRVNLRRPKIGKGQDRCPPGFEFGGRFTNSRLSTCGTRLFDLPSLRGAASDALSAMKKGPKADDTLKGTLVRGNVIPNSTVTRRPEIPAVGALNIPEINTSVTNNIPLVATDESSSARLVRRDGSVLSAMVSIDKLASTRNNADIADGVIIRRATDPSKIGDSEIGLLAAGARSAVMVFPDGSSLTLSRTSKATPESIRGMSRRWATLRRNEPDLGYGSALEKFVAESNGKLELKPEIKNVKGPLQLIEVQREDGSRRMVRRWIFEIFLAANAPSRPDNIDPWTAIPSGKALPQGKKKAARHYLSNSK